MTTEASLASRAIAATLGPKISDLCYRWSGTAQDAAAFPPFASELGALLADHEDVALERATMRPFGVEVSLRSVPGARFAIRATIMTWNLVAL